MVVRRVLPLTLPERESSPQGQSISAILSLTAKVNMNARLRLCEDRCSRKSGYRQHDLTRFVAQALTTRELCRKERRNNSYRES